MGLIQKKTIYIYIVVYILTRKGWWFWVASVLFFVVFSLLFPFCALFLGYFYLLECYGRLRFQIGNIGRVAQCRTSVGLSVSHLSDADAVFSTMTIIF